MFSIEGNNTTRRIAEVIVAKWPDNPWGYHLLGLTHLMDVTFGTAKSPQESLEKSLELAQKALAIDESLYNAHILLSGIYSRRREFDKGVAEGKRAVDLAPNGADAHDTYAQSLIWADQWNEAIPVFQKAIRLNPIGSSSTIFTFLGIAYIRAERFNEAISAFKQALLRSPNNLHAHVMLAATYIAVGREKEARAEAAEVLRLNPKFSLDKYVEGISGYFTEKSKSILDTLINRLRKAGLK